MGKGFYVSKAVGVVAVVLCAGALATIIALSVVYSQEKTKSNQQVSPTDGGTTSNPPVTPAPSNELWDKYRLPKVLKPDHYNVTLWPRLTLNTTTGLYIFTGNGFSLISDRLGGDHFLHPNELHPRGFQSLNVSSLVDEDLNQQDFEGIPLERKREGDKDCGCPTPEDKAV